MSVHRVKPAAFWNPRDPWVFYGAFCTARQAHQWRLVLLDGVCPWCRRAVPGRFNNRAAHLIHCPQHPEKHLRRSS